MATATAHFKGSFRWSLHNRKEASAFTAFTHTHIFLTLSRTHFTQFYMREIKKIHFLCRMLISPCRNCIILHVLPDIKALGCFTLFNLTLHSSNTQRRQSKSHGFLFLSATFMLFFLSPSHFFFVLCK